MPKPTAGELVTLRKGGVSVKRYCSILPRTSVYTAQINGVPTKDPYTGGCYELTYDSGAGTLASVIPGMTLDIGTMAGARDVGSVRIRKAPTATKFFIAESAPGKLALADNLYLTVREEYRLWQKLWRLVQNRNNANFNNSFTQYKDYDVAYSDQNSEPPPLANIAGGLTAEGDYLPVRLAGWVDAGQTYRTVTLKAVGVALAKAATISSVLWDVADGTIVTGTTTTADISVRFPAVTTCRYIRLTVTDSNGKTGERVLPIWVHDAAHPPLSNFRVERDDQRDGRDMTLVFFGNANDADETDIPQHAACVYWEVATFDGDAAPAVYIDQAFGWAARDTLLFRKNADEYTLELAGAATWLNNIEGPNDRLTYQAAPNAWNTMSSITVDRLVGYLLQQHTTFPLVCNYRPSGVGDESKEEAIPGGSIWTQVTTLAKAMFGIAHCDSLGGLTLRRHPSYLSASERAGLTVALALTPADWTHESGLVLDTALDERVGQTEVGGKSWNGSSEQKLLARAPGRTPSHPPARDNPQGVILPAMNTLQTLLDWSGHHWAWLNNPRPETSLALLPNLDVVGPGEIVSITNTQPNLRGASLNAQPFLVTGISRQHENDPRAPRPPKTITLTLEQETQGSPGQQVSLPASAQPADIWIPPAQAFPNWNLPPLVPLVPGDLSGIVVPVKLFAVGKDAGEIFRGTQFDVSAGTLTWENVGAGVSGEALWGLSDPYNYFRRFVMTKDGLWRCDDLWAASPTFTQVCTEGDITGTAGVYPHYFIMSHNKPGWMAAAFGNWSVAISYDRGVSWIQRSMRPGSPVDTTLPGSLTVQKCHIAVAGHNSDSEGWLYGTYYVGGGVNYVNKSEDYGDTWGAVATQVTSGVFHALRLDIPYKRAGGANNVNGSALEIYLTSQTLALKMLDMVSQGTLQNWSSSVNVSVSAMRPSTTYTHDGAYNFIVGARNIDTGVGRTLRSVNGYGASAIPAGDAAWFNRTDSMTQACVNGYPTLPDFALAWMDEGGGVGSAGRLVFTTDGGVTWTSLAGGLGMTNVNCVYAEGDLSDAIPYRG